ncbi:antitoxin Xre/MbcA/ParS toxin-binding domain-containing protein [Sulfitobacter sp. SBS6]
MRFLEKPNPDLGGAVPMALAISSPAGADAVIELLTR